MPTYDYLCNHCGHRFEFYQYMTDDPLTTCPNCSKDALQRLIGAGAGLLFKGSGFYLTDYRKSSSSPAAAKHSSDSDASAGNSSSTDSSSADSSSSSSPKKDSPAKPSPGGAAQS